MFLNAYRMLLLLCVAVLLLLQLAAAACCCCSSSCAGWQNMLLWFIESESSILFLFIQTRFISHVHHLPVSINYIPFLGRRGGGRGNPRGRPSFSPVFCVLSHYNISSVIAGMREAKAGVSPPRRSPLCMYICIVHTCSSKQ